MQTIVWMGEGDDRIVIDKTQPGQPGYIAELTWKAAISSFYDLKAISRDIYQ